VASVTRTLHTETRRESDSSRASAVRTPRTAARANVMLVSSATATVPCEFDAAAKAKSASVKIAPPCATPTPFKWSGRSRMRTLA
jgi:hypothetical protein